MHKTTSLLFCLVLLLTSYHENTSDNKKVGDRLLEDPEHHIKDNPSILKHDSSILYTGWYYIADSANGYKRQLYKQNDIYFLNNTPIITPKNFTTLEIYESIADGQKYLGLAIRFDKEGTETWSIATNKSTGKYFAFIMDNQLLQVSKINSQITGGVSAINRGDYSKEELENFKTVIESER